MSGRLWLKVEPAVLEHRKVIRVAAMFGVEPYLIVGFLLAWWSYCVEHGTQARAAVCPDLVLDRLALPVQKAATKMQVPTMKDALRAAKLMNRDGRPHDWEVYSGEVLTRRAKDAQRKRLVRTLSADTPRMGRGASRVEKSRVEKRTTEIVDGTRKQQPKRLAGADFLRAVNGEGL
jgi:hypothetical protein